MTRYPWITGSPSGIGFGQRVTNRIVQALAAFAISCGLSQALAAEAPPADALRGKQDAQERARAMARELVTSVLDIQLKQLAENGLDKLPVYGEIGSMRKNIDQLVDAEMRDVVALLVQAQHAGAAERDRIVAVARDKIREIVIRLSVERQQLLRRLKIAELSAQVVRLIQLQSAVLRVTETLGDQPKERQESLALGVIHDQRDVKALFLQLVDTLADVSTWGGPLGSGAADGLRILKLGQVGQELDNAGDRLDATRFAEAAVSQRAVIKGLRALLEKVEQIQGLLSADHEAAMKLVRELVARQESLREQTKQGPLDDKSIEPLVDRQTELRRDLNKLNDAVGRLPAAAALLEQAKGAATAAAEDVFQARQDAAVADQSKVVGSLVEIEEQLKNAEEAASSTKSADQLAQQVRDLEKTKQELAPIQADAQTAVQQAAGDREAARKTEERAADKLDKIDAGRNLPQSVKSRLAEAAEATDRAAAALGKSDEKEKPATQAATEQAQAAVERAAAEVHAALADAKRQQLAVQVGELARAAEALERAAAAERAQAAAAASAAKDKGLNAADAKSQQAEQAEIAAVAAKTAEGVKHTAPAAAATLAEARKPIDAAQKQLSAANQTPQVAGAVAEHATKAADKLTEAAAQLRKETGQAAAKLAEVANEQLKNLDAAQKAVEATGAKQAESIGERLDRLAEAKKSVQQAQAEQARAEGRQQAASAMDLANKIAEASAEQARADRAAETFEQGRASTPLEAAIAEQRVAEASAALAKSAAGETAEALKRAEQSAGQAAKEMVHGNPAKARDARADARQALQDAVRQSQADANSASQNPPGSPNAEAQKQAGQLAEKAAEQAAADAPAAAQSAAKAGEHAQEAADRITAAQPGDAAKAQQAVGDELKNAAQGIQKAIDELAKQEAGELARQAQSAGELAKQTAAVDPGATAALRSAAQAAQQGAEKVPSAPAESRPAEEKVQRGLERAAANIAARHQRVARDKAIAESLAQLAEEQQRARNEIVEQGKALEKLSAGPPAQAPPGEPSQDGSQADAAPTENTASAEQQLAAQALKNATERFAEAQKATGQGAAEVANQEQIANRPLREALQRAGNLNPPESGQGSPRQQSGEQGQGEPAQGQGDSPAGQSESQTGEKQQSQGGAEPGQGKGESSQGQNGAPQDQATPGEGQSGQGQSDQGQSQSNSGQGSASAQDAPSGGQPLPAQSASSPDRGLGEGFVPDSPEVTAAEIAGDEALSLADAALGQSTSAGQGQASSTSSASAGGGSSRGGRAAKNQPASSVPLATEPRPAPAGDSRAPHAKDRDTEAVQRQNREDPWVAKLPPELRKAIRAKSQRRAPRGYEHKLERYFENVE